MKNQPTSKHRLYPQTHYKAALAFAACCAAASLASAAPVTLGNFAANGTDPDDTITLNSNLGGTRSYGTNTDTKYDGGINTAISPLTLTNVGDKLVYSFSLGSLTVNQEGTNSTANAFRSGFALFDGTSNNAHFHFTTGVNASTDGRFAVNNNNNRYSGGTNFTSAGTFLNDASLRFDDGNSIDVTFTLELTANNTTSYNFLFTAEWASGSVSNSMSQAYTNILTNRVVGMYHLTNSIAIASGSSWTVSGAQADFTASAVPEPSAFAAFAGLGAVAFAGLRRRRCF